eukprot:1332292-Pyramimonas_sp.AAC.1
MYTSRAARSPRPRARSPEQALEQDGHLSAAARRRRRRTTKATTQTKGCEPINIAGGVAVAF